MIIKLVVLDWKLNGTRKGCLKRLKLERNCNRTAPGGELSGAKFRSAGISLYFLVGKIDLELHAGTIRRIEEVSKMSEEVKKHVYALLDAFLKQTKLQSIL